MSRLLKTVPPALVVCVLGVLCAQSAYDQDFLKMAKAGQTALVKALLAIGADLQARDENGRTALMLAAAEGHDETVMLLLLQGADLDAKDGGGRTALVIAEQKEHASVVEVLKRAAKPDGIVEIESEQANAILYKAWDKEMTGGQEELQEGHYDEAERLFRSAVERAGQLEDQPLLATSLSYLGLLYHQQGQYDKAEPLYQRALVIAEKALGAEHPTTAGSLNNLAALYLQKGNYTQAEPLYQRALEIAEKVLGSEHPDTATSLNNLAALYHRQGKYAQAEPL